jgi:ornithine decarboxylase
MKQIGKDEKKHWKPIGVDCASPAEMRLALAAGFKSSDLLYANTMKAAGDLKTAQGLGIERTTVDSVEGVEQLQGSETEAIVRLAVDDTGSRSPFSVKFGAHESEWRQVMDAIRALKVRFGGVSFHVGSASGSTTAWADAIRRCVQFQQVCKIERLPTLDIGGGFLPNGWHFAQAAQGIVQALVEWREAGNHPETVIAEPGRFFSAPVETLIVPIVFKKESTDRVRYVLDDSVYGQFSGIVYDHAKPAWRLWNDKRRQPSSKQALFFGRTCDSLDLIATQDNAPQYKVGDRFVFPWMGAYTSASATRFNGFELPKRVYLEREGGVWNGLFEEVAPVIGARYPIETVSNIPLSV